MRENNKSKNYIERFLGIVENVGNSLPHPTTLFALFAISVIILSWFVSIFDFQVIHPGTGEIIKPISLLSTEGFHKIILNLIKGDAFFLRSLGDIADSDSAFFRQQG